MEYVIKDTNIADIVLGKQAIKTDVQYRLLNFCHIMNFDDKILIFNNLNKKLVILNSNEAKRINQLPTDDISDLIEFIENWFLVPIDNDDCLLADQIYKVNESCKKNDFINNYVILTTTDCNARCYYCFEHGVVKNNMSRQTANDVVDFIVKKSKGKKVYIKWFGGEPLYNVEAIDIICDGLIKNNIEFENKIVTNGYLFNNENIKKAVTKWNIKNVQISLDGTEEKYNRIKNYIYKNGKSAFKVVIGNIENLLKNDIAVSIRLNVSDINREDIYSLIDYLYGKYSKYKKFGVYAVNLFDLEDIRPDFEIQRLNEEFFKMDEILYQKGYRHANIKKFCSFDRGCMAQRKTSVCISPIGLLGKCEHFSEGDLMYGSIYNEVINQSAIDYWHQQEKLPECKTCLAYPCCGGMYNCPDISRRCAVANRPIKYHNIERAIHLLIWNGNKRWRKMKFRIAGFNVFVNNEVNYIKLHTKEFFSTFDVADISLDITNEDVYYEVEQADSSHKRSYLQYNSIHRKIAEWLPQNNAFVLHSATFDVDGVGVAFAAHSGTGKTTHMNLWQKLLGDKMTIVNGDKPIVRFFDNEPETPYAYGTPWNGKEHLGCNIRTPLKHICFIERSETNYVEKVQKNAVIDRIFNQVYMPKDPMAVMNTMKLIDRVLSCTNLWIIHCNMEPEAAEVAYNAIINGITK